jgi:hypothetical protein
MLARERISEILNGKAMGILRAILAKSPKT